MGFTPRQQQAIDTAGCELLVSAAAGSGKTAVLVERIIRLITQKPVGIDRLLVVTFTEAAAAEMRGRISERLHTLARQNPADDNLRRQLALLPRAQISTIHKFCADIVRRNFHLTELDPSFKIADEFETRLLKSRVLDELFEERYEDPAFYELVDYYGGGKTNDRGLHDLVLRIAAFVSGFPWHERWLADAADMYAFTTIDDTLWADELRLALARRLEGAVAAAEHCLNLAAVGADKYITTLSEDRNLLHSLQAQLVDLTGFRAALCDAAFVRLRPFGAKDIFDSEVKEHIQSIRNSEIKPVVGDLKKLFPKPLPDMERDLHELRHVVSSLTALAAEFITRYGAAKRRRNIADFNDLEQFALKVLLLPASDENSLLLTDTARELRRHYAEVMIDEYQDSNLVQELILSAVADGNRFMVGDVKQSIYKFRGARPELFMEKCNVYTAARDPQPGQGVRIDLSTNFRSRRCVVDAVNLFFSRLMTVESEIDYDDESALYCGADFPDADGLRVADHTEVIVIDGETDDENDLTRIELEAMSVAARINELTGSNTMVVYDKGLQSYRKARFCDIVILLRSAAGISETFLDVLKRSGIPAYADTSTGFFDAVEVMTLLSFLQIIDNPRQDIPLLAVLRSPVYGLTDDELLAIRAVWPGMLFIDCVRAYPTRDETARKLERFLHELDGFRREAVFLPIGALIDRICDVTGYFNYAGAMPGGAVRQANLRLLREKAVQYEETSYRGLFHFNAYIRQVKERADEGSAKAMSENADVVRLMTIHKSKGLEFPIVFVSMLGRKFSRLDERGNMILHGALGVGSVHIDLERRVRSNTLAHMAVASRLRRESIAEELRVLYVALTRAREMLILTGSAARLAKESEKWGRYNVGAKMPAHMIFAAECALDWLMPVLTCADGEADIEVCYRNLSDIRDAYITEDARDEERRADIAALSALDCDAQTRERLEWVYPHRALAGLPAKISISEIKRLHNRGQDSAAAAYSLPAPVYTPPRFLQGAAGPTPAGRGTVMHTVLEHMDMTRVNGMNELRTLVSGLVERGILTAYEAGLADLGAMEHFCRSDICRRIMDANPGVWRETPFVLGLTPYQIYREPAYRQLGSDAKILVHGIIDCYFEEDGRLVLVDYKTGRADDTDALLETYNVQMAVYKLALERATGKQVDECLLYLFDGGRTVHARPADLSE